MSEEKVNTFVDSSLRESITDAFEDYHMPIVARQNGVEPSDISDDGMEDDYNHSEENMQNDESDIDSNASMDESIKSVHLDIETREDAPNGMMDSDLARQDIENEINKIDGGIKL